MKESGQRKGRGGEETQMSRGTTIAPTLADLGITKDQSSKWQELSEIPEDEFEEALARDLSPEASASEN